MDSRCRQNSNAAFYQRGEQREQQRYRASFSSGYLKFSENKKNIERYLFDQQYLRNDTRCSEISVEIEDCQDYLAVFFFID